MTIPPSYSITNTMLQLITNIEARKVSLQHVSIPDQLFSNLKHQSLLRSSVYSAQIEGNSLSVDDADNLDAVSSEKQYERQEVENIITALTYIRDQGVPEVIDVSYLLQLHKLVMHKLVHPSLAGNIRTEPSAIFDQFGNVIYMTPPPGELSGLLSNLLTIVNDTKGMFPLIQAPIVHMTFEKIHPFLDGNGRVGRLLLQSLLARSGYHFNWLLSIEEVLQEKKQTYYSLLDQTDATTFIEFMLTIIVQEAERLTNQLTRLEHPTTQDFLLPRRAEILSIIKDQPTVSFDQIKRRFVKIPDRTLRYDIKQLEKAGLIRKIGTTRGSVYQAIS